MLLEKTNLVNIDGLISEAGQILKENKIIDKNDHATYQYLKQVILDLGYTTDPDFYDEFEDGGLLKIDVDKETINGWLHIMGQCLLYLLAQQEENSKLFDGTWKEKAGDRIGQAYEILLDSVLFRDCEDAEASRLRFELVNRGFFG